MSRLGECCKGMELVLSRRRESDRLGVMIETMYSLSGGKTREVVVVRFHKAKDRKAQHADVAYCVANYCPFCGAKQPSGIS